MEPMATARKVLTWLCIVPADEETTKFKKLIYIACTSALMVSTICGFLTSSAFIIKFMSTNLEDCLYALIQICATVGDTYMMLVAFILRHKIAALFDRLAAIYRANADESLFRFLAKANDQCEWIWPIYFKFLICGLVVDKTVTCAFSVVFCGMKYDTFNSECVYLPYKTVVPWNQRTPLGYFAEFLFHISTGEAYLILNGAFLYLFTCMCLHHRAFYERFQYSVSKWNEPGHNRNRKESFCDLVRFHIMIKDFFLESADVYSLIVFIQLVLSLVFLASAVFQVDLQIRHPTFEATLIWVAFMVSALNLFVYCFFGKLATDSFATMADCLFEGNWVGLPIELQKYFILAIGNAQRPLYYHGFGVAILNLQTLTQILKTVYTYYMMFKTITAN